MHLAIAGQVKLVDVGLFNSFPMVYFFDFGSSRVDVAVHLVHRLILRSHFRRQTLPIQFDL